LLLSSSPFLLSFGWRVVAAAAAATAVLLLLLLLLLLLHGWCCFV